MLTLKPPLYLFPAVALLLICFAVNAEARGGSHSSGGHSLSRPAGASATTPMPAGPATLPTALAGSNARANAVLAAPAAASAAGVTASAPGVSLASPGIPASSSAVASPAATTAASAGAAAAPALSGSTPAVAGPAEPAAPEPALPALSPMSDPLPTQFATGGGSAPNLALSPSSTSSSSPSESAPSSPGGGGKSLQDCMGFWDAATHMTKPEWRAACKRSMAEFPDVKW